MTESEEVLLNRLVALMAEMVGSHLAQAGDRNWKALDRRLREWQDARGVQRTGRPVPASPSGASEP